LKVPEQHALPIYPMFKPLPVYSHPKTVVMLLAVLIGGALVV